MSEIRIQRACEADVPKIRAMIHGLAVYEKLEHVMTATEEQLRETLFGARPGAEVLLAAAKQHGIKTLLVSGGFTHVTSLLQPRLGLDYTCANTLAVENGKLTGDIIGRIVNSDAKRDELIRVRDALGIRKEQIIGMGDGANDLPMLREAGVSVAYHAKPVVRAAASVSFDHVGLDGLLALFPA